MVYVFDIFLYSFYCMHMLDQGYLALYKGLQWVCSDHQVIIQSSDVMIEL